MRNGCIPSRAGDMPAMWVSEGRRSRRKGGQSATVVVKVRRLGKQHLDIPFRWQITSGTRGASSSDLGSPPKDLWRRPGRSLRFYSQCSMLYRLPSWAKQKQRATDFSSARTESLACRGRVETSLQRTDGY